MVFKQTGFYLFKLLQLEASRLGVANIVFEHPNYDYVCKMVVLRFENELEKDYVLFAKAKGLGRFHILNRHILRNVLLSTLFFAKTNIFLCYLIYIL